MKKNRITILMFALFILMANFSPAEIVTAATSTFPTKGQQKLENQINAEAARLAALKAKLDPSMSINHTIRKSSHGNDVKLLQQFLKIYGVYPEGFITGYFGNLTEAAVKRFQNKESIETVGIAGPKTRARILEISHQRFEASQATSRVANITEAVLSAAIAENGAAAVALTRFASTTENIYTVLRLKNAKQDSEIAYIRYHNGIYVDSEVSHPSRNGLTYFHFQWSLKPGKSRTVGNYSLEFYIDGKKSRTIHYAVY